MFEKMPSGDLLCRSSILSRPCFKRSSSLTCSCHKSEPLGFGHEVLQTNQISPSDKPDKPAERSMRWKEIIAPLASYERKKSKGSSDSNCSPAQNVSQCSNTEPWSRPAASGYSATAPGGLAWSALLHWHPELLYEHPKLTALPRIFINFIVHSFLPIKLATYRGFRKWGYTCSSSTSDFPL